MGEVYIAKAEGKKRKKRLRLVKMSVKLPFHSRVHLSKPGKMFSPPSASPH
jgi:hypothetical protein